MGFLPVPCSDEKIEIKGSGADEAMYLYGLTSSTTAPLERGVQVTGVSEQEKKRMGVLHEAVKVVKGPLH